LAEWRLLLLAEQSTQGRTHRVRAHRGALCVCVRDACDSAWRVQIASPVIAPRRLSLQLSRFTCNYALICSFYRMIIYRRNTCSLYRRCIACILIRSFSYFLCRLKKSASSFKNSLHLAAWKWSQLPAHLNPTARKSPIKQSLYGWELLDCALLHNHSIIKYWNWSKKGTSNNYMRISSCII
jgi:hypothetical protein